MRDNVSESSSRTHDLLALWVIEWKDGRRSILTAPDSVAARIEAKTRLHWEEGWRLGGCREIHAIRPVVFLELSVASRKHLNVPKFGRILTTKEETRWLGPHRGTVGKKPARGDEQPPERNDAVRCRLWSYVWSEDELVLFTAPDHDAAVSWAMKSSYGGTLPATHVEQVEDIEMHLAPVASGYAPTCYRVWIEGCRVGWPPTESQTPWPEGSPPAPLPGEARMPVPTYVRTDARGTGRRSESWRVMQPVGSLRPGLLDQPSR